MAAPLAIAATGMITGVGLSSAASCAAIRAGLTAFDETRFIDEGGQWILGSQVPLPEPTRGTEKLVVMASMAIREALVSVEQRAIENIPLFLCVAEPGRTGRLAELDASILDRISEKLRMRFHGESRVLPQGRMAGVTAIQLARSAIHRAGFPLCLIVGVDSFLNAEGLKSYETRRRLLTSQNTNGFIPGEAAAAALLAKPDGKTKAIQIVGLGSGHEPAPIESGEPLRSDGLVGAFRAVLTDAGCGWEQLDYRITDISGEQYFFREATLAMTRSLRVPKIEFDIWHAADCIGEVGAAAVPCALALAYDAAAKDYAPGPGVLCHFSCDGPERAAIILRQA